MISTNQETWLNLLLLSNYSNLTINHYVNENIRDKGAKFINMLNDVKKHYPFIATHVTGQGLLCALHIKKHYPVVNDVNGLEYLCRKNGLNVIHGGKNALRFTPNFNITDEEIELVKKILFYTFEQFTNDVIRN